MSGGSGEDDTIVDIGGDITGSDAEPTAEAAAGIGGFFALGVRGCRGFFGSGWAVLATALGAWDFGFGGGRGLGVDFDSVGRTGTVADCAAFASGNWDITSGIGGGGSWDGLFRFFLTSGLAGRSALNRATWSWSAASYNKKYASDIYQTFMKNSNIRHKV